MCGQCYINLLVHGVYSMRDSNVISLCRCFHPIAISGFAFGGLAFFLSFFLGGITGGFVGGVSGDIVGGTTVVGV